MSKIDKLKDILNEMQSVLIAYSGGVDSTFLLKIAKDVLGEKVLAVTAESETYTSEELLNAKHAVSNMGVKHLIIHTNELSNEQFIENTPLRCYFCKKELFTALEKIKKSYNLNFIIDGTNASDNDDYRPGHKACHEFGIRSPLLEADFHKTEIREYSKELGLSTWDKPSQACLSSRFPYGEKITIEKLHMVSAAEKFLIENGFKNIRVRYYYPKLARIEIDKQDLTRVLVPELKMEIILYFKNLGFKYITLDLEGFRTGSMNEVL